MTTQHTPAPWSIEIDHHNNAAEYIRASADGEMYDLASVLCDETGNATANARLIAAAPDLLAALEACLYRLDAHDNQSAPECLAARAAIAKATGVQP
jgi:hypothetical protein